MLPTETMMGLRDKMRLCGVASRAGHDRQAASVDEHFRAPDLIPSGKEDEGAELLRWRIRSWEPIFATAVARAVRESVRAPLTAARC